MCSGLLITPVAPKVGHDWLSQKPWPDRLVQGWAGTQAETMGFKEVVGASEKQTFFSVFPERFNVRMWYLEWLADILL